MPFAAAAAPAQLPAVLTTKMTTLPACTVWLPVRAATYGVACVTAIEWSGGGSPSSMSSSMCGGGNGGRKGGGGGEGGGGDGDGGGGEGEGGGGEGSGLGGGVGGGGTGGGLGGGGLGGGRIISNVVKPGCSCVDESEHPIQMRWCSSGRRLRWVVQLKCVHVLLLVVLRKAQHSSWHTLEVVTLKCLKTRGHPTVPMSHIGHLRPGFASGP